MAKTVDLKDQIIPKYYRTFNDKEHTHMIFTSGRAGTKSSRAAIKAIYSVVSDNNCSGVFIRKFHNKLRKTVYKEVLRAITRLGLKKKDFKITASPLEIKYLPNGNTIYFTGSDSIDDTKGMIDEEKQIKFVVVDELTEFFDKGEGEDELMNIEATFIRGNDGEFRMEYYFNPPKNPKAPIMKWVDKMKLRSDCIYIHTDYRDVPQKWLGQKLINSALELLKTDKVMYEWLWLGKCVGVPDVIYYMFSEKNIRKPERYDSINMVVIGIDYGQMNATTFEAFGLDIADKVIQGLGEYYYSGREMQKQKSPSEYAADFKKFKEYIENLTGKPVTYVVYDPSALGFAEEIKRVCPMIQLIKANNSVDLGISRVQKLYSYLRLLISPDQRRLIEEMSLYKYDEKSIERGKEVPVKQDDHCCDAERYAVMKLWKYLKYVLPDIDDLKTEEEE